MELRVAPAATTWASGASVHRKIDRAEMRVRAAAFKSTITVDGAYPIRPSAQIMPLKRKVESRLLSESAVNMMEA